MKLFAILALAWVAGTQQGAAQATRFFRISGPAATAITTFQPDGTMPWSNEQPGATYTIQTVSSLPGGTNWVDYVQIPTGSGVTTNRLIDFNPPDGMVLIPAGSFTMGNSVAADTDMSDTTPVSATVSAFYMDVNEVTLSQ